VKRRIFFSKKSSDAKTSDGVKQRESIVTFSPINQFYEICISSFVLASMLFKYQFVNLRGA